MAAAVNKYAQGKIYCIRSPSTDRLYIGSTCDTLAKRLYGHRLDYKRFKAGKYGNMTSFELIRFEDHYIELLEACPCANKNELTRREGEVIRATALAVNKKVEGRTPKEYRVENKVAIAAQQKEYRVENIETVKAKKKETHDCLCGGRYATTNKALHHKTQRHIQYVAALPVEPVAA